MASRTIIMVAQTPPPSHGQAVMTQLLKESLEEKFDVHHVRMHFSKTIAENKEVSFFKFFELFRVLFCSLFLLIRHPGSIFYYPPSPGHWVPILRDMVLLSFCRPLAKATVFHFHARGLGDFLSSHKLCPRWAWVKPEYAIVLASSVRKDADVLRAKHIFEIPYGIDLEECEMDECCKCTGRVRILFAGLHTKSKGIFDLLDVAGKLKHRKMNFEVVTAGEWASEREQEIFFECAGKLGVQDIIHPLGVLTGAELQKEYAAADIFFFPTFFEHETFGVVVIEAMAHGLPVVASNWAGPADIIKNNKTGFLCEPRNVDSYADALQKLIESSSLREKMGDAAKELYCERYTRATYSKAMTGLFAKICDYAG